MSTSFLGVCYTGSNCSASMKFEEWNWPLRFSVEIYQYIYIYQSLAAVLCLRMRHDTNGRGVGLKGSGIAE